MNLKKLSKPRKLLIAAILTLVIVALIGFLVFFLHKRTNYCNVSIEYDISSNKCKCPKGYELKKSMTWGKCPTAEMTDCPKVIQKCIAK